MQVERYRHFKWTPRTAWLSILFAVAIPSSLYYVANKTDVSRLYFVSYLPTLEAGRQELEIAWREVDKRGYIEEKRHGIGRSIERQLQ